MLFDKYWNYTTCIEYDNLDILESSITEILEQEEGCQRIFELPKLNIDWQKRSRYTYLEQELSDLWIVAIFPGIGRWGVIKTFPTGLICDRSLNSSQPYLANLTKQIKCNAFHLEVHDSVGGFLFEVDFLGKTFLSGSSVLDEYYSCGFHDELKVDKDKGDLITNFWSIDVPEPFKQAIQINESSEVLEKEQRIAELDPEDPEYFDLAVDEYLGYSQRIDLAFADLFDPNRDYWFFKNSLVDVAYNSSDRLKLINAKILYFQPPTSYLPLHIRLKKRMIPQTTSSPEEDTLF